MGKKPGRKARRQKSRPKGRAKTGIDFTRNTILGEASERPRKVSG